MCHIFPHIFPFVFHVVFHVFSVCTQSFPGRSFTSWSPNCQAWGVLVHRLTAFSNGSHLAENYGFIGLNNKWKLCFNHENGGKLINEQWFSTYLWFPKILISGKSAIHGGLIGKIIHGWFVQCHVWKKPEGNYGFHKFMLSIHVFFIFSLCSTQWSNHLTFQWMDNWRYSW